MPVLMRKMNRCRGLGSLVFVVLCSATLLDAQPGKKEFGKDKGFPGGPGGFGPPMGVRKIVARFDKDGDGRLSNEERKAAREVIKKEGKGFGKGGFGPGGFGPGGFGPGGFGPGGPFVQPLLQALDADRDGKLSREEVLKGVNGFVAEIDKDRKDLDQEQIAEALDRILPPPKFGPGSPPDGPPFGPRDGFGPPKGEGPGKGPPKDRKDGPPKGGFGFFGPGNLIAGGIVSRADSNKDSKASLKELLFAAETLFKEVDADKDGKLDEMELGAGIAAIFPGPGGPGFGKDKGGFGKDKGGFGKDKGGFGKGPFGEMRDPPRPGPKVSIADVKAFPDAHLYDPDVLRTIFLEFENADWEAELADFYKTDVEVPATMIVDGKKYLNVGVHFRGMSSYGMVPAGYKKSLNVSVDFVDTKQRLYGYKTLNLLNASGDPSLLSTALFSHLARQHIPAPKANFVKVVINGESWGVYANVQQFNADFLAENYKTTKGARWKVPGSPGGAGGLEYLGENIDAYRRRYELKSRDSEKDWKALANLCRVLNETPLDKLEEALRPILDIEGTLWFLALDIGLINSDGYWTRASDFSIYRDPRGVFHIIPHDMNEAFQPGFGGKGGFGGGFGGKGGGGIELDPLTGLDDARKPLRSRLLKVPSLRDKYLGYLRQLADDLDWKKLGPVVGRYRSLLEKEVASDTRKLSSLEAFTSATADRADEGKGGRRFSLRSFADQRREYLLGHPAIKKAAPAP